MPEPTEALVRTIYDLFSQGAVDQVLEHCAPDVEWVGYGPPGLSTVGTFSGRDGVATFFRRDAETFDVTTFVPGRFIAEGNRVAVFGHESGTMKQTGVPMENQWAHAWEIERGLVVRFVQYLCHMPGDQAARGGR